MRWPIRNQILLPVATVLLLAVASTTMSSVYFASRKSEQVISEKMGRVADTLRSGIPYSANVLANMKGLSGAEFIVYDEEGTELTTTFSVPIDRTIRSSAVLIELSEAAGDESVVLSPENWLVTEVGDQSYFAFRFHRINSQQQDETVVVLYPSPSRWEAAKPPLIVGGCTLLVMMVISVLSANRMGRRIHKIQTDVAEIAAGNFHGIEITGANDSGPNDSGPNDELQDLTKSVNRMSRQLSEMQNTLQVTERSRLLGQLAGGLAHQLRNAVTGAQLAIQIHQRRCPLQVDKNRLINDERAGDDAHSDDTLSDDQQPADESLAVALRQLSLTETQIKSLLTVGKPENRPAVPQLLRELVDEVAALISPACEHAEIVFRKSLVEKVNIEKSNTEKSSVENYLLADSESVRTALLNLLSNAIDAVSSGTGTHSETGGEIDLHVVVDQSIISLTVSDNGPGPPPELAGRLTEVFVTGKQEGVGLGLALVQQIAEKLHGQLTWSRCENRTVFCLEIRNS